jgi:hypothetical protein
MDAKDFLQNVKNNTLLLVLSFVLSPLWGGTQMKRLLLLLVLIPVLLISACGGREPEPENVIELEPEPEIIIESAIDFEVAARLFAMAEAIWDEDDGALWGVPLHAPLIIGCGLTRDGVANQPMGEYLVRQTVGDRFVYAGILPDDIPVSNTVVATHDRFWGIVRWEEMYYGESVLLRVLIHEGFHTMQRQLHDVAGWSRFPDGNSERAQNLYNLELSALAAAWHSTGEERLTAVNDALYFRNARRQQYVVTCYENLLEIVEGLAIYTEMLLLLSPEEIFAQISSWPEQLMNVEGAAPDIVAARWGYWSGALYGFLLDEFCTEWRSGTILGTTDLGGLLQQAAGILEIVPPVDLERYGYSEITAASRARVAAFEALIANTLSALESPLIRLPIVEGHGREVSGIVVVPQGLIPFWPGFMDARVWTSAEIICQWGRLNLEAGHLLDNHDNPSGLFGYYLLAAPVFEVAQNRIYGEGWVIELNDGWALVRDFRGLNNYWLRYVDS